MCVFIEWWLIDNLYGLSRGQNIFLHDFKTVSSLLKYVYNCLDFPVVKYEDDNHVEDQDEEDEFVVQLILFKI